MTRKVYIFNKKTQTFDEITPTKGKAKPRIHIQTDEMPPAEHMATGEVFTSKSSFRRATKEAGCVEIGDQRIKPSKPSWVEQKKEQETLKRQLYKEFKKYGSIY